QAIEALGRARPVTFHEGPRATGRDDNVLVQVLKETEVVIPMESMVDLDAERQRLGHEITQAETEIARLETRLADQAFLGKAPAAVIERERRRLAERHDRAARLKQELDRLR
ncbi:MAG: valine--tRNA ligase, partial [Dehalococcoidales bacterium]